MRSWFTLAAMAVAVVALGYWSLYRTSASDAQQLALSSQRPETAQRIVITRLEEGRPRTVASLERSQNGWRMMEPVQARADDGQVERLLTILRTQGTARHAATDLARYGLDAPQTTLTIDGVRYAFGTVNTLTREQYVGTPEAVYSVPLVQRTAVPRDAEALLSKSLFAPDETPVRIQTGAFSASLTDGRWVFEPPVDVLPDDRNAWAQRWRNVTAVGVKRTTQPSIDAGEAVAVEFANGRTVRLTVLAREPDLVLLRPDEGLEYQFFADTAQRLLEPPSSASANTATTPTTPGIP